MLKIVLHTSGVEVVFSGVSDPVQALMRSHGVIAEEDPVFSRYDSLTQGGKTKRCYVVETSPRVLMGIFRAERICAPSQDPKGPLGTRRRPGLTAARKQTVADDIIKYFQ